MDLNWDWCSCNIDFWSVAEGCAAKAASPVHHSRNKELQRQERKLLPQDFLMIWCFHFLQRVLGFPGSEGGSASVQRRCSSSGHSDVVPLL